MNLGYKAPFTPPIQNIKTYDDWLKLVPKYMSLPIRGFRNPDYHCLVTTSHFAELIKRGGIAENSMIFAILASNASNLLSRALNGESDSELSISAVTLAKLAWNAKGIAAVILPQLHYAWSYHFNAIQPIYGGFGFTELKNNKIARMGDNALHTILSPWEFIMFNHPIHATCDGKVVEIVNEYEDRVRQTTSLAFNTWKPDQYLGNKIVIEISPYVRAVYANVKKNSFTKKVGETVHQGEIIARVGMSGQFSSPYLFFALQSFCIEAPLAGNMRLTLPSKLGMWDTHYASHLLDYEEYYGKNIDRLFERFDNRKIRYSFQGSIVRDLSLVKQYPNIQSE